MPFRIAAIIGRLRRDFIVRIIRVLIVVFFLAAAPFGLVVLLIFISTGLLAVILDVTVFGGFIAGLVTALFVAVIFVVVITVVITPATATTTTASALSTAPAVPAALILLLILIVVLVLVLVLTLVPRPATPQVQ